MMLLHRYVLPVQANEYAMLCQRLSSLMSRITNQLSKLAYDHAELAKTLEEAAAFASSAKIFKIEEKKFKEVPDAEALEGSNGIAGEAEAIAEVVVSQAVRRTALATQDLTSLLSNGPASDWREAAAFGEAIKRVLKNRQAIQVSRFL